MSNVSWTGVYPAVITPFKSDDSIDFELFKLNVETQLDAGIEGIILAGSLGEASTLLSQEKIDLLLYCNEFVEKRVPVIVNIAEQATKAAVLAANEAEENGADGLMLLPPMRYFADDRETFQFFKTVANNTSLPLMIYNNPVDYKILATLDMFEKMAAIDNIRAVKDSTRDISNITRMNNRFGDRFRIMAGVDTLAYESLCAGADGLVAGLVNAFPRETVCIYRLIKAGQFDEALRIHRWFLPVLELDIQPKLVQYIKLAAAATGIGSEFVRAPRLTLEGRERERVMEIIYRSIETRPELTENLKTNVTM